MKFNCSIVKEGEKFIYNISGAINEAAVFPNDVLDAFTSITIDLNDVIFINSTGVGKWVNWIKDKLGTKTVIFRNVPVMMVNQMNSVKGFLPPHFDVESIYVPFYVDKNDEEHNILAYRGEHFLKDTDEEKGWIKVKENINYKGHDAEADVVLSKYFNFLVKA